MALREDWRGLGNPFDMVEPDGKLMIFGRPTLMWEGAPTPEEYYKAFGFSEVHTLDVSDYEGSAFVHDLNALEIPEHMRGRYRAVHAGGTIEHIFNIANCFKAAVDMLEVGGAFLCSAPVNNWVDHGFYQISPTLKFDYFAANDFDFGFSVGYLHSAGIGFRRSVPVYPGEAQVLNYQAVRVGHSLMVQKKASSTTHKIPMQSVYSKMQGAERQRWRFRAYEPADIHQGGIDAAPMRHFALDPAKMIVKGNYFAAPFREEDFPPSVPNRPFRSTGIVYEDGHALDWIVSDQAMIPERNGSFIHAGAFAFFSASDGSDPRKNGRTYEIAFPHKFKDLDPYPEDPRYRRPVYPRLPFA